MWSEFDMRQGDRLPSLSLVIESDIGVPVVYDPLIHKAVVRLTHQRLGSVFERDALIVPSTPPTITYDWQEADWFELPIGVYDLSAQVLTAVDNHPLVTAPSGRNAIFTVHPYAPLPGDTTYWDDLALPVWDDPLGLTYWR
jgi:hypothetical protein